jgi:hypothetical protein
MTEPQQVIIPADLPPLPDLLLADVIRAVARVPEIERVQYIKDIASCLRGIRFPMQQDIKRALRFAENQRRAP